MKSSIKFPLSAAALLILAACGGQGNGNDSEAGSSVKAGSVPGPAGTAQSTPANPAETPVTEQKLRQRLAARLGASGVTQIAPAVAPVSEQGVRGDVVLAALGQLAQTGTSASPLQLSLGLKETGGIVSLNNFESPLNYHSTLSLGSSGTDSEFNRTSQSYVSVPAGGTDPGIETVTLKYGVGFIQNRLDRINGDMVVFGNTLQLRIGTSPSDQNAKTFNLTTDSRTRLNWKQTYNASKPVQTWSATQDKVTREVKLTVKAGSGQSFQLCEELRNSDTDIATANNPMTRTVCTEWIVPDNWRIPQKLQRNATFANEDREQIGYLDMNQPDPRQAQLTWENLAGR